MSPTVQQLREWLRAFVDGDSSKDLAGRIEVRIPAMPIGHSGRCRSPVPAKAITRA
jgi:hypothetical protein